jgi:two-component system, chemotaxis family, chemotaxis protein CheY
MRALVVDDSSTMRKFLGKILHELEFEVVEAANGLEALKVIGEDPNIDVALFDWDMPVMDGMELLAAVRADRRFESMPVMMVTSNNAQGGIIDALEHGANEYVMKPFNKGTILEKLKLLGLPVPDEEILDGP